MDQWVRSEFPTKTDHPPDPETSSPATFAEVNRADRSALAGASRRRELYTGAGAPLKEYPQPRYARLPIVNDDLHVVGHEMVQIGPALVAYLRRAAEGGAA